MVLPWSPAPELLIACVLFVIVVVKSNHNVVCGQCDCENLTTMLFVVSVVAKI